MKYILINDIISFFRKYKKLIFCFELLIILILLIQIFIGIPININLFKSIVGLNSNINDGLFSILIFLLNLGFHLIIIFQIFDNDIKNGTDNIFLRIKLSKWLLYKFVSIILLNFIFRIIIYVIVTIIFLVFSKLPLYNNIFELYFVNLVYIFFIDSIFLNFYIILKKYPNFLGIILFLIILCLNMIFIDFSILINNIHVFLMLTIALSLIFFEIAKSRFLNILEIGGNYEN